MKVYKVAYNEHGTIYQDVDCLQFVRHYEITHLEPVNILAEDVEHAVAILKSQYQFNVPNYDSDDAKIIKGVTVKEAFVVCDVDYHTAAHPAKAQVA